tara:strand:+ start:645 stop:1163 length:519 start_codon:yes stop_codon:yes gene_type:complete
MSYKKKENLNARPYWERSYAKKQKYKNHEDFHYRGEIKITGKETDMQECKECHRILSLTAFTSGSLRSDGAYYLKKLCRECQTEMEAEKREARKNAPPKSEGCDCCHGKNNLEMDHLHGTSIFRGWVCRNCNSGIGSLGDTLEGLLQAAVYLEKDKSKIIETLNRIKKGNRG